VIGLVLASATCMALDTVLARAVTREVDPIVLVFFRNLFGLLVVLPWLWRLGRAGLATAHMGMHIARAAIKIVALILFFWGIGRVALAEATAVAFATPLFTAAGAALLLGESLRRGRLAAILVGFVGVLIVIRPGLVTPGPGALAVLGSTVLLAAIALIAKVLARHDSPTPIVALNLALSAPLALLPALLVWTTPSTQALAIMALQGAMGAFAQFCVIRALSLADASLVTPLDFARLPLVAVLAYFAFGQIPDGWTWTGAAVICLAILLLVRSGRSTKATAPSSCSGVEVTERRR
jgi:drug/metabolite transporter (DMT)-like permease